MTDIVLKVNGQRGTSLPYPIVFRTILRGLQKGPDFKKLKPPLNYCNILITAISDLKSAKGQCKVLRDEASHTVRPPLPCHISDVDVERTSKMTWFFKS